jgi:hypothetical protein
MFKFVIKIIFLISLSAFSSDYIEGNGTFISKDGDALGFVKKHLLDDAFKDVVLKELDNMGLNSKIFWDKIEEKFNKRYLPVKEQTEEKYSQLEQNVKNKEKLADELRMKSLNMRRSIIDLNKTISSYVIKRMSRSSENANIRYIKIEAKVDRQILSKIYYSHVAKIAQGSASKLYIYVSYDLIKTSFNDLGVRRASDFTQALQDSWSKWFRENKSDNFIDIEFLSDSEFEQLNKIFTDSKVETLGDLPNQYQNSVLMHINIVIQKNSQNVLINEYSYNFAGGLYFTDLNTKKVIGSSQFMKESKRFQVKNLNELSTLLANFVYRMPFSDFLTHKKMLNENLVSSATKSLNILNFTSVDQAIKLLDTIKSRGIHIGLDYKMNSFNSKLLSATLYFEGDMAQLTDILTKINEAKYVANFSMIETEATLSIEFI